MELVAKALEVHERLLRAFGQPALKEQRDPLSELILTILSQNTSDLNSGRAFDNLVARFPTWGDALASGPEAIAAAIQVGGLANVKAPRIHAILTKLESERGELSLDLLAPMPVDKARAYLLALPGVGPKTAACVLLFSLHKPALPVDTHVHRVSQRVGLVSLKASAEKAHSLLEELLPQQLYYPFHLNLIRLGREVCAARSPRCDACPLADICDDLAQRQQAHSAAD